MDEVECIWMSHGLGGRVSVTDSDLLDSAIGLEKYVPSLIEQNQSQVTPGSSTEFSMTASAASIVEKGADGDDDDDSGGDDHKKQEWSNPLEFLLSCIAMSVGLGSKLLLNSTHYLKPIRLNQMQTDGSTYPGCLFLIDKTCFEL